MPPRAKGELLKLYRAALRKYIEANASLEGLIGPEFAEAHKRAEEARAEFEKLRQELLELRAQGEGA
jgi:hypothetical protein